MSPFSKIFSIAICLISFNNVQAQSGGPPMITDDPGVVDLHKWEINTSLTSSITNNAQFGIPYIDANYGVAQNLQLKVEGPYLITIDHSHFSSALGEVLVGVKFRFLDEAKNFVSGGTYPQLFVNGQKGLLLPLLLEKTFGKFLIGEDIGFFFGKNNYNNLQIGSLLGYKISEKFQVMGEYFMQRNYNYETGTEGFINFGFRQVLTKTFNLMGSFGSQSATPSSVQKQYFISYLGIQSDF